MNERKPNRRAATLRAARAAQPLTFRRPDLPIGAERERILEALSLHQVLIVAGETGSGKSTQLPQYCLELGRGLEGLIAHTQPRRLAARALAARIAEEVSQPVGRSVGFKVRFADQSVDATRLLLMTDGLLLAELAADPLLTRYDTVIVDEAHERSLNVDLLLGVLKGLLPRRPELKVIVTSATLDIERIAAFFGDAPVIRVSGRGFPVEVRHAPQATDEDPDLPTAVLSAYAQIANEPGDIGRGDILVFLPGEREIRDVGELLERELKSRVEVMPLYSRLSWEQQSRIFQRAPQQRIVLATNVAETSITVPNIRSVIDSGLARISRYSLRSRLQRLPIEAVSQASALQRQGRCGRVGPGLCLRLYTLEDFEARAAFTEPEVLRTNLAALLLRLAADGLGEAERFPFIDAPDARALNDGYRLLQELQALDEGRRITRLGRSMARLPLDPRLARALIESKRFRVEGELLAIVAGLSVPDAYIPDHPKERSGAEAEGEEGPALTDTRSDFSALISLWRAYRRAREGTRRELRQWCKERHLSLLRLSEWDDVHSQVSERAREMGIVGRGYNGSYTGVHRALLAGFTTLVGGRGEQGAYLGTRGVQFHLFPGSPLARRKPKWVMAANIVETSRVFARRVAQVEPAWIEAAAAHLLKREYLEPDWSDEREAVVARERVSFLGLTLSANRIVNYGPIAPEEARRIFAREALVYGRLRQRPEWLAANDEAIAAAQRVEERLRSRDLLVGAESWVDFYDTRLPRQVSSAATLEYFTRHLTGEELAALSMRPEDILAREPDPEVLAQFPERTPLNALAIPVEYRFAPGEADDGASLRVPLLALPQLTREEVRAAVPGLAAPRIEALLRSLPKDARRSLIPIGETVRSFLSDHSGAADIAELSRWLHEARAIPESLLKFDPTALPKHLTPQILITQHGVELGRGAKLAELRRQFALEAHGELLRVTQQRFGTLNWRRFEWESLPESVAVEMEQGAVTLFPTLIAQGRELRPGLAWSAAEAAHHWEKAGVQLARQLLGTQARDLERRVASMTPFILSASAYFPGHALSDTLVHLSFKSACFADAAAPRTREAFDAAVEHGRARLHEALEATVAQFSSWLADAARVRGEIEADSRHADQQAALEAREHLKRLFDAETLQSVPRDWLRQWSRYLKAEQRRWQRNQARGAEAATLLRELNHWTERVQSLQQQLGAELRWHPKYQELTFWVEEYRVSLYAQELRTLGPVSAARLEERAAEIDAWLKR